MSFEIGVISDTHGLLRPEAVTALAGCAQIIHAGDVGTEEVLVALQSIAPVAAVRGNVDHGKWAEVLPTEMCLQIGGCKIVILHDLHDLSSVVAAKEADVVISGHSHKPAIERLGRVVYLNPGSAGRRRFSLPVTLAKLIIADTGPAVTLIQLLEQPSYLPG